MSLFAGNSSHSFLGAPRHAVAVAALLYVIGGLSTSVVAQDGAYDPANHAWQAGAIRHAQRMRAFFDSDRGQQTRRRSFQIRDRFRSIWADRDHSAGWSDPDLAERFLRKSRHQRPHLLFLPSAANRLDRECRKCAGSLLYQLWERPDLSSGRWRHVPKRRCLEHRCEAASVQPVAAQRTDSDRAAVPATIPGSTVPTEYRIVSVTDPYGCNTNPTTGLTSFGPANPTAGIVSVYRRPLPSTI